VREEPLVVRLANVFALRAQHGCDVPAAHAVVGRAPVGGIAISRSNRSSPLASVLARRVETVVAQIAVGCSGARQRVDRVVLIDCGRHGERLEIARAA
jgi:hypothetical protein